MDQEGRVEDNPLSKKFNFRSKIEHSGRFKIVLAGTACFNLIILATESGCIERDNIDRMTFFLFRRVLMIAIAAESRSPIFSEILNNLSSVFEYRSISLYSARDVNIR